jgi:hypothetical protein
MRVKRAKYGLLDWAKNKQTVGDIGGGGGGGQNQVVLLSKHTHRHIERQLM